MSRQRFYPYPVCQDLTLVVDAIDPDHGMDASTNYLRLWEVPAEEWRLRAVVNVPDDASARILHETERDDPPLDLVLTLRSTTSRRREAFSFPYVNGETSHELTLDRATWSGLVEVDASLVRTKDAATPDGAWARRAHMVVGRAPQVRVDVDEPARPPGDSLAIEWADFATSPVAALNRHPDHLFALRSKEGEAPVLYLNQGVEGAVPTLTSTGSTGHKARARDAVFQMIAHQVWSSVLSSSLCELKDNMLTDDDVTLDDALDQLAPWMRSVVEQWAPWLFPDSGPDEVLHRVWELVEGGKWEQLLTERLPTAIEERFDTTRGFRGLVKEYDL